MNLDLDIKFIQAVTSDNKPCIINIDQIVAIKKTENGCIVKTPNPDFSIPLNTSFDDLITMLPSLIKIEDINL